MEVSLAGWTVVEFTVKPDNNSLWLANKRPRDAEQKRFLRSNHGGWYSNEAPLGYQHKGRTTTRSPRSPCPFVLLCPLHREVVIVRLRAGCRGCGMPAQIKFRLIHRTIPFLLVSDAHQAVFDLGGVLRGAFTVFCTLDVRSHQRHTSFARERLFFEK